MSQRDGWTWRMAEDIEAIRHVAAKRMLLEHGRGHRSSAMYRSVTDALGEYCEGG